MCLCLCERATESELESVSLFVRPQALTNGGTITFVLINIVCSTPLELCLSSLLFFYNHKMQMRNSDMIHTHTHRVVFVLFCSSWPLVSDFAVSSEAISLAVPGLKSASLVTRRREYGESCDQTKRVRESCD